MPVNSESITLVDATTPQNCDDAIQTLRMVPRCAKVSESSYNNLLDYIESEIKKLQNQLKDVTVWGD